MRPGPCCRPGQANVDCQQAAPPKAVDVIVESSCNQPPPFRFDLMQSSTLMPPRHASALITLLASALLAPLLTAQAPKAAALSSIGPEAFQVMRQFFDYDQGVDLDVQVVERSDFHGHAREKIVFNGSRKVRVPAYLALPKGAAGPAPCVLLLHGLTSSKESWWRADDTMSQLTRRLLDAGFAVMALDAEYHGERLAHNDYQSATALLDKGWFTASRDMMIQSTIEYRRALDYLGTRTEIDAARIGAVGYSMGGIMTFMLAAAESRVKAVVTCVSPVIKVPHLVTNVANSAPYLRQPLLMLMATQDERNYTETEARQLLALAGSEAKDLKFFASGHMLPAEWTPEAAAWMQRHL